MNEGHYIFGEVLCDHFDIPMDLHIWAKIPDAKIYKPDEFTRFLFHRWTLHGFSNVDTCIIKGGSESNKYEYKRKYDSEIRCMIISHTYLDLFNGPIVPSYPESRSINILPSHLFKYPLVALNDPPEEKLKETFESIIGTYSSADELAKDLKKEYKMLPNIEEKITNRIKDIY